MSVFLSTMWVQFSCIAKQRKTKTQSERDRDKCVRGKTSVKIKLRARFVCAMMGAGVAAALARFDEAFCLFKGSNNVKRFLKDPSGIGAAQRGRLAGWLGGRAGWRVDG
jgi:hypothetical protein